MLLPPVLNKRYDTLERLTALLKEPRVKWVLAGTGAGIAAIDAISISASGTSLDLFSFLKLPIAYLDLLCFGDGSIFPTGM
jgi:hypothetical protein